MLNKLQQITNFIDKLSKLYFRNILDSIKSLICLMFYGVFESCLTSLCLLGVAVMIISNVTFESTVALILLPVSKSPH